MIKPLFAVHDSIAGFFSPVFVAENTAHATRMMAQSIDLQHAADFSLWQLGQYNSDDGIITETTPALVVTGLSLKTEKDSTQ